MTKMLRGLLAAMLSLSIGAQAALNTDRTFIAHRDELASAGMAWTTTNHYRQKGDHTSLGAVLSVTPFYQTSTNDTDLAKLFGNQTAGGIKVGQLVMTQAGDPVSTSFTTDPVHTGLYDYMVDHAPGNQLNLDDVAESGEKPMYGTVALSPKRTVWGVDLHWDQSLDTVLKGLRFSVRAPLTEVSTNMKSSSTGSTASAVATEDGVAGKTLDDFFNGNLTKNLTDSKYVSQKALSKAKVNNKWHSMVGVGDIDVRLHFSGCNFKRIAFGISAGVQLPTGNHPTQEWMFEPVYGKRGHLGAGVAANVHIDGFSKGALHVGFDVNADWKYFFEGTEKRLLGVYDLINKAMVSSSHWRNIMRHSQSGVQPAANVLAVAHSVTPGHQLDALAGVCAKWHNWTIDLGYNLFWHEKETVVMKSGKWASDRYAFVHPQYNMATAATTDDAHSVPVTQHKNLIGSAGLLEVDENGDGDTAGNNMRAYTDWNGPVQLAGKTTSALRTQSASGANSATGNEVDGDDELTYGTLSVQYNTDSRNAVTESQLTHSIVGGIGYKFQGNYPVILGIGGQCEFQESDRNSALEGYKVWAKVAFCF